MLKSAKAYFPFLTALAAGICFISLGIIGGNFTHYPGDLIDGRFNNYLLEHAYNYFTGRENSFWSAPYMYPEKNVITYSDNLLGTAPFYSLFRLFGCDRQVAYQCWYLLIAILNFISCYALLKYLFKNNYAAAGGAMVFAFSLALHSQMGHAQTFPRFAIPLSFLSALVFLKELKPIFFFLSIFLVVYQIYCGIYIGFMLAISVGLFFLVSLFFKRSAYLQSFKQIKWWGAIVLSLIVNLLILMPLMVPYLERAAQLGYYDYHQVAQSLLTAKCFLYSWWGTFFWGELNTYSTKEFLNYADFQVFTGTLSTISILLFFVLIIVKIMVPGKLLSVPVSNELYIIFTASIVVFLVFLRFGDFSFYKLIYNVPGFGSLRALQRIINIELMFFAIATAFCINLLLPDKKYTPVVFLVFVIFFITDNYVKPDYRHRHEIAESIARIDPLIKKIRNTHSRKILSYEPDTLESSSMDYQLDAMLAAQSLGLKTLNGYSSTPPPHYNNYWSWPNEQNRMEWLKTKGLPMDSVVVVR
jgi:hypothetical protein